MSWFGDDDEDQSPDALNQEEEQEHKEYTLSVDCINCEHTEEYDIPVGITFKEFLKRKKCEVCKCLIMKEDDEK